MKDQTLIRFGGAVRATGGGKFEAPLVQFSDAETPDLIDTYFDSATDFWVDFPCRVPLLYGHGFDPELKRRRLGEKTPYKGKAETALTDAGVWMQGQLDLRDEYEAAIYEMIEAGKMGTSSGSAGHLVEYEDVEGSDVKHMTSWPLVEGSLTPTPAEPRNLVSVRSVAGLLPKWKHVRGVLKPDWDSRDPYEGIGRDLTAQGLDRLFQRILWSLSELMDDEDPGGSADRVGALIDRFADTGKRYVAALIAALTAEGAAEVSAEETASLRLLAGRDGKPVTLRQVERLLGGPGGCTRAEAKELAPHVLRALLRDSEGERGTDKTRATDTQRLRFEADRRAARLRMGVL